MTNTQTAQDKIGEVMQEYKKGKLRSVSGDKVKSHKQSVAIGISEARKEGKKVPPIKKSTGRKNK